VRAADNPFRSECLERIGFRLVSESWGSLLARLEAAGRRGAIVGPQGSGKTTMLAALGRHLEIAGWSCLALRLDTTAPRLDAAASDSLAAADARVVVLLDGAEQLGHLAWLALRRRSRRAAGLVITTHGVGRLGMLYRCSTSAALLAGLVAELLPADWPPVREETIERVFAASGGNIREALSRLYDACARSVSPAPLCLDVPG
jgi:hypothetical protein